MKAKGVCHCALEMSSLCIISHLETCSLERVSNVPEDAYCSGGSIGRGDAERDRSNPIPEWRGKTVINQINNGWWL